MPAVQQRVSCLPAATQGTVWAAAELAVGQLSLVCPSRKQLMIGNVNQEIFVGLEKEKNEDVGRKVGLEARMEAAEAAHHLLWSKIALASNLTEILPLFYCIVSFLLQIYPQYLFNHT